MDDARVIAMPVAGRGIMLSLVWHYWLTDCAPLPKDRDRLFAIAQAHKPTWSTHSATILAVLHELAPKIAARFAAHHARRENMKKISQRGASMSALLALNSRRNPAPLDLQHSTPIVDQAKRATRRPAVSAPDSGAGFVDKLYK
jgi:uncharacterized protein YdaU (DUF1376 family)